MTSLTMTITSSLVRARHLRTTIKLSEELQLGIFSTLIINMKIQINPRKLALVLLLVSAPSYTYGSSWFGSDSAPSPYPSAFSSWTPSQYESYQNTFSSLRDSTFDAWDESRLREWLLEQGVIAPKGPREEIVLVAKRRWKDWQEAKAKFDASAASMGSSASSAASSVMSGASASVSSAATSATSAVTSYAAQATADLPQHPLDDTKDYIWSTWDDTKLRKYLVQQGVIDDRTAAGKKRDELIAMAKDGYKSAEGTIWETWSDSYIVSLNHPHIIRSRPYSCFSITGSLHTTSSTRVPRCKRVVTNISISCGTTITRLLSAHGTHGATVR